MYGGITPCLIPKKGGSGILKKKRAKMEEHGGGKFDHAGGRKYMLRLKKCPFFDSVHRAGTGKKGRIKKASIQGDTIKVGRGHKLERRTVRKRPKSHRRRQGKRREERRHQTKGLGTRNN